MIVVTANDLLEADLSAEQRAALGARAQEVVTLDWFGRRVAVCFDDLALVDELSLWRNFFLGKELKAPQKTPFGMLQKRKMPATARSRPTSWSARAHPHTTTPTATSPRFSM